MNKTIPVTIHKVQQQIEAIPFESWPSREVQGIACELVDSLQFEYNSHARLTALISAQVRLSKAIADACQSERSNLASSAAKPIYYGIGKSLLEEDYPALNEHLKTLGDAMEAKR